VIFKIISSNIRFDNPHDGIHRWENRKHILARIINDFNSDFLATQEGRKTQLFDLASLLNNLTLIDSHRKWITERMYPCIFINPHTIRIYRSGDIWLSKTPSIPGSSSFKSTFPRLCTWVQGQLISTSHEFFFVNVHLDHILAQTRQRQIEVLIREVKKTCNRNIPLILSGDFNESPNGKVRKVINEEFHSLYDPWPVFNSQETSSHHSFDGTSSEGERIDWILIDKKIECLSIFLDTIFHNNIYPSDHYPVKGTFRFL
jgi:endonuclease/exonuclease/phosphatase family metal-dependent hydrolase